MEDLKKRLAHITADLMEKMETANGADLLDVVMKGRILEVEILVSVQACVQACI